MSENAKLKMKNEKRGRESLFKKGFLALNFAFFILHFLHGSSWAKYEQEQVAMETNLQQKIETILSKTLPPNSYLITVKVEMEEQVKNAASGGRRKDNGNPFLDKKRFVLPGVPQKNEFSDNNGESKELTPITVSTVESLVKKITITILVAPDIPEEKLKSVTDLLNESLPFNPLRGDELVIRRDALINSTASELTTQAATAPSGLSSDPAAASARFQNGRSWSSIPELPQWIMTGVLIFAVIVFLFFLLGPVRAFLNRLLIMLPRVGEAAALNASREAPGAQAAAPGGLPQERLPYMNSNPLEGESDQPFHFIRPEQLSKLPVILKPFTPEQTALVLAYLPAEWASQVLSGLDSGVQSAVIRELSLAREIPAERVREIELYIKERLPYWVGGAEWIQAVYQRTQPQMQRTLLGAIGQQSPDLAQALRRKSFFFEDMNTLDTAALRILTQEAGYPILAASLRDERPEIRNAIVAKLPAVMRTIVQQELELSKDDKTAIADAKARVIAVARRLINEGRLKLSEHK